MKYETTKDPNIIKQIETVESEIFIDKLEAEVKNLQEQADNMPKPKTKPDQETLDCWNEMNVMPIDETELKEKQDLLKVLKDL